MEKKTSDKQQTERIQVVLGVTPGYGHSNEEAADEAATFVAVVEAGIRLAGQVQKETEIYPSFHATPGKVGYSHDWGCPQGGEFVVALSGDRNPQFCNDPNTYLAAWTRFAELLKKEFKQTTATLTRTEIEFLYLQD
ncbi:MAG: hypothetical protein ABII72_02060 [Parcubacteria group bacterium]